VADDAAASAAQAPGVEPRVKIRGGLEMRRILIILAGIVLALGLAAPVLAADPKPTGGPVLMAFNGDITVQPDQHADVVMVTDGTAIVAGHVETLVVIDGTARLTGATVDTIGAVGGTVSIDAASTVTGDVRTLGSTVSIDPAATVKGEVTSLERDITAATAVLAPMALLFMLGLVLVTVVAGLALAALAARQVRSAEQLISREPGGVLLSGLAGLVLVPIVAILAMITVLGAPLGFALMFMVWPAAAFAGYLVAGIWIGEWLLNRSDRPAPERPYVAAVVGLLILQVVSLVPFVGAIASLFGFGAVLVLAWRVFRGTPVTPTLGATPTPRPIGA
jgi:hypothetical protein